MYYTGLFALIVFVGLYFLYSAVRPSVSLISDGIEITDQWTELSLNPPIESSKEHQYIYVQVPDIQKWEIKNKSFIAPGGEEFKIETVLTSTDGTNYEMSSLSLGSYGLGFSLSSDTTITRSSFASGERFTSVRFRSNHPIKTDNVTWVCLTNY